MTATSSGAMVLAASSRQKGAKFGSPVCHRLALVSWSTQSGQFGAQMHAVRARARLGHHWSQSCSSGAMLVVSSGGRTPWLGCQVVGWHGRGSSGLGPAKRVSSCRLRRPPALPPTSSPRSRTCCPTFLRATPSMASTTSFAILGTRVASIGHARPCQHS